MSINLLSLSYKRIINDCIEKIVLPLNDLNNKIIDNGNNWEDDDEIKNDINIIKSNNDREKENEEEEEEQNEDGEEKEEDEKIKKLINKKKKFKNSKKIESCLLIIDDQTSKILSSFLSLSDLLNTGLFSVENISRIRVPFPKSNAIYMIYPTRENCEKIIYDFRKIKKPLYKKINIYFMESSEENILDILVNENIINRIKKCYDLNLSYYIYDKNIFTFGYNVGTNLHILKCPKVYREKKVLEISLKLFTVCSVLNVYPNIVFQLDSYICQFVSREVDKRLKNLYKNKKIKKSGILLITDRTLDPISPAMHDYSYSSLVYDLLEKYIKPAENKKDIYKNILIDNLKGKLDYNDSLWNKYKDLHIVEALTKIPEDFDEFKSSNIGKIGITKNNMRSSSKLEFELQNITIYQNKNQLFNLHLTMASELNKNYKSKFYREIIEHEQDILLGVDINGKKLNFNELYDEAFLNLKLKIQNNDNDIIRLLMIYLYSYNINQNEFNDMISDLNLNQKKIFDGLKLLKLKCNNNNIDNNPYKRNNLELLEDINDIRNKKYNVIRAKNKILSIIEECARNKLNEEEFQYTEEPENIKYKTRNIKKKKLNKFEEVSLDTENDLDNLKDINKGNLSQLLIYFNIGGLSINEITSIRNLSKNNELGFKIVLGSTGIYSSNQYLKELIYLVDNQDNDDVLEIEDEEQKNDINIEISNKIENIKNDENGENNNIKIEVKEEKNDKKKSKKDKNDKNKKDKNKKDKKGKDKKKKEKEKEKKKKTKVKLKTIKNESDSGEEDEKEED